MLNRTALWMIRSKMAAATEGHRVYFPLFRVSWVGGDEGGGGGDLAAAVEGDELASGRGAFPRPPVCSWFPVEVSVRNVEAFGTSWCRRMPYPPG